MGILPLMFFLAQAVHYLHIHEEGHLLWMCNIGNLLLALGMFLDQKLVIRLAVIWAIPGLLLWILYVVPTWGLLLAGQFTFGQVFGVISSSLAHLGGIAVGIVALKRVRMDHWTWLYAFIWYLIMQFFSRWLTSAAMNVNLSHRVQDGWESSFESYWKFWIVLTLFVAVCAWLLTLVLRKIWPASDG